MVNIHTGVRFLVNWSFFKFSISRKKQHMLHIEKTAIILLQFAKNASRYHQNYAHRKLSKKVHKKNVYWSYHMVKSQKMKFVHLMWGLAKLCLDIKCEYMLDTYTYQILHIPEHNIKKRDTFSYSRL